VSPSGVTVGRDSSGLNQATQGNRTTTAAWLNTTNSNINTTATYYDTGMPSTSTDANNNTSTYTYDSTYGAYLIHTQLPNTGTVSHSVSATYDPYTGLMTQFTDQNNQAYNYNYDPLWRMTSANFPDTGMPPLRTHLSLPCRKLLEYPPHFRRL